MSESPVAPPASPAVPVGAGEHTRIVWSQVFIATLPGSTQGLGLVTEPLMHDQQLGRIQWAAQMLTVFASAIGPLCFAWCHERFGTYQYLLIALAVVVLFLGFVASRLRVQAFAAPVSAPLPSQDIPTP